MKPKPRMYALGYVAPGHRKARTVRVGFRALELLELLAKGPASRYEMVHRGRTRVGLNASSTVSVLRDHGIRFQKRWITGLDEEGNKTRWMEYRLKGRITEARPIQPKGQRNE